MSNFIRLTKKEIETRFHQYNALYFNGEIITPKYFEVWTPWKNTLGMVRPCFNKLTQTYSAALHISKRYNWTDENLKKVIIHEMIHLYLMDYLQPLQWWERLYSCFHKEHDSRFKDMMNYLNETYNLDIKIRFKEMRGLRKW
ncbi:MAG: SprT-like domain-containing protein [Muribaculaceae bacterium]|nr:SprT-like domain-containing protein [Muribaculaceae bacterium]